MTVTRFGKKNSEGISIESLLLQDEHQLLPMGKVQRNSTNDQVRTAILACRDFLPFPPIDLAVSILGEMAIEVHGLPVRCLQFFFYNSSLCTEFGIEKSIYSL